MIRNIYRRHKGFIAGALLASLLWSLGVIYISYTTAHSQTGTARHQVKMADIQKRADITLHRAQRTLGNKGRKKSQQEKLLPSASVTIATETTKSQRNKMLQKLKSQNAIKQMKPTIATLSMKFSTPSSSILKNKLTISEGVTDDKLQVTQRALFISDGPVAVRGIDFWMEAGMARSDEEKQQKEDGFSRHAFNQYASDRLGYFREVPDTRHALCRSLEYPPVTQLPNTSVIICFHNEAQSALLRTVHSVIHRSPAQLIHEIILVDDASTFADLKDPLDKYVAKHLPIVTVVRTTQREGLIRARLLGAQHATGMVLTFLDSHCEVNRDWLVPLLTRLKDKPTEAVVPVIDVINHQSLAYTWVGLNKGGFDWGLSFKWHPLKEHMWEDDHRKVLPFSSPAMAGGLFSIYRNYFFTIGAYDDGMDIWGGENVEISLRLWMCGGGVEIIPCSRVGHIFRSGRPYISPGGDTMGRNVVRVAEVWLDDYKEMVYQPPTYMNKWAELQVSRDHPQKNPRLQTYERTDISSRVMLRKKLQCHTFQWYLDHVYPELMSGDKKTPTSTSPPRSTTIHTGLLRSVNTRLCLTLGSKFDDNTYSVTMERCDGTAKNQEWSYMDSKQLVSQGDRCLQAVKDRVVASVCKDTESVSDDDKDHYQQLWLFEQPKRKDVTGQLFHVVKEKCLLDDNKQTVTLGTCSSKWTFIT